MAGFTKLLSDLRIRSSGDPAASDVQSRVQSLKSDFYVHGSDVRLPRCRLLPKIVEADLLLHQLLAAGDVLGYIAKQEIHQGALVLLWAHKGWPTANADHLCSIRHGRLEVAQA